MAATGNGHTRTLEVERKYDADEATPLPDWAALPGVARVGNGEVRQLDARYLDTPDVRLAAARVALRRRTGGPDEGWHVKISSPEGKHEWSWPLDQPLGAPGESVRSEADAPGGASPVPVPAAIVEALTPWAAPPFVPLARIRNTRTAYALYDANGGQIAEFVDDRVDGGNEKTGAQTQWREWELELGPAAPSDESERAALFAAADELVIAAGGRVSASASKLGRALGV